ncbi:hypothetical protein M422DRAFT_258002 [Sphaerobolus stellatus SS14]|uniref:Uncharacterized protein n=1 Tax=Sphaerobolus stellatus (strain SS14) TaxID=990650 RepID=A0A0C9VC32_SPHS4|nr:hypothetical protein M422DRAFT_258002 [Sphaerobolus stellatus SS14]
MSGSGSALGSGSGLRRESTSVTSGQEFFTRPGSGGSVGSTTNPATTNPTNMADYPNLSFNLDDLPTSLSASISPHFTTVAPQQGSSQPQSYSTPHSKHSYGTPTSTSYVSPSEVNPAQSPTTSSYHNHMHTATQSPMTSRLLGAQQHPGHMYNPSSYDHTPPPPPPSPLTPPHQQHHPHRHPNAHIGMIGLFDPNSDVNGRVAKQEEDAGMGMGGVGRGTGTEQGYANATGGVAGGPWWDAETSNTAEDVCHSSNAGIKSEAALKSAKANNTKRKPKPKPRSDKWCSHHNSASHNTDDCFTLKKINQEKEEKSGKSSTGRKRSKGRECEKAHRAKGGSEFDSNGGQSYESKAEQAVKY